MFEIGVRVIVKHACKIICSIISKQQRCCVDLTEIMEAALKPFSGNNLVATDDFQPYRGKFGCIERGNQ